MDGGVGREKTIAARPLVDVTEAHLHKRFEVASRPNKPQKEKGKRTAASVAVDGMECSCWSTYIFYIRSPKVSINLIPIHRQRMGAPKREHSRCDQVDMNPLRSLPALF